MQINNFGWPPRPQPTPAAPAAPPADAPAARPLKGSGVSQPLPSFLGPTSLYERARAAVVGSYNRLLALADPAAALAGGAAPTVNTTPASLAAAAQRVVDLVNATRSYYGLAPLEAKFGLQYAATKYSRDMATYQYFSHTDRFGRNPIDRFRAEGISFRYGGENIAYGQLSADEVMQDWMNSAGHRANILDPNFKYLGVGIAQDAYGRLFWTQEFSG